MGKFAASSVATPQFQWLLPALLANAPVVLLTARNLYRCRHLRRPLRRVSQIPAANVKAQIPFLVLPVRIWVPRLPSGTFANRTGHRVSATSRRPVSLPTCAFH